MRDKLIQLIMECSTYTPNYEEQARLHAEYLAQHLLNEGVIVPPCKVGDIVYEVDDVRIYAHKVKKVIYDTESIAFDETAIGKSIFVNGEEAEKTLERRWNAFKFYDKII